MSRDNVIRCDLSISDVERLVSCNDDETAVDEVARRLSEDFAPGMQMVNITIEYTDENGKRVRRAMPSRTTPRIGE